MVVVKMVELVASRLHGYVLCRLRKALSVELKGGRESHLSYKNRKSLNYFPQL